jgi:TolB-like protein/DNA-binding winged helix-turn-helix (wHTH) protein
LSRFLKDEREMRDAAGFPAAEPLPVATPALRFAALILDLDACTLTRQSGEAIPLTRGELALLRMFVTRPGRVISRDGLLDAFARRRFEPFDRSVDVLVGKLRRKIEPDPKQPRLIVTVPGEGYRFDGLAQPLSAGLRVSGADLSDGADGNSSPPAEPLAARAAARPLTQAKPPNTKQRSMRPTLAAAIFALVTIAGGAWYWLAGNRSASPVGAAPAAHLSVVVLPFANLSGDPAQDYFADSITDNLTTDVSRIRDSFVIARNTAFTFKGKSVDAKEIGKELGVRYVLEGSVQREGTRVRVNAQLIDAETGAHIWADRFEEDVADLFKLQDQVVARLANALNYELVRAEAEAGAHSKNPDVIDLDMRGADALWRFPQQPTKEGILAIRALFEQALKIDPDDADALGGSAATYLNEYAFGWANPGTDYEAKVLGQVDRAIALAPRNPWNYSTKSVWLAITGRPKEGLRVADAALAINPNYAAEYTYRALAESYLGQFEQAKSDVQQAMRLSPRDPRLGQWHDKMADAELGLGRFDAAIDESNKAIDAGFRAFFTYLRLGVAHALKGDIDEAKTALTEARRLKPELSVKWLTGNKAFSGYTQAWYDALRKAGLPEG